jgi:hypothetical protein
MTEVTAPASGWSTASRVPLRLDCQHPQNARASNGEVSWMRAAESGLAMLKRQPPGFAGRLFAVPQAHDGLRFKPTRLPSLCITSEF